MAHHHLAVTRAAHFRGRRSETDGRWKGHRGGRRRPTSRERRGTVKCAHDHAEQHVVAEAHGATGTASEFCGDARGVTSQCSRISSSSDVVTVATAAANRTAGKREKWPFARAPLRGFARLLARCGASVPVANGRFPCSRSLARPWFTSRGRTLPLAAPGRGAGRIFGARSRALTGSPSPRRGLLRRSRSRSARRVRSACRVYLPPCPLGRRAPFRSCKCRDQGTCHSSRRAFGLPIRGTTASPTNTTRAQPTQRRWCDARREPGAPATSRPPKRRRQWLKDRKRRVKED